MLVPDPKEIRQPEASSIPDRIWDVVIVGAGPAGSIAAAHLAANHHRVLFLDRKRFPREKVCGDGLLPDAIRCLETIGVGETVRAAGLSINTSTLISPSYKTVDIPGEYLTIKRSLLDMIVARRAVESGAFFAVANVEKLAVEPDGLVSFTIQGCPRPFRSRIGVVATGVDLRLMHKMNWPAEKRPSAVALRCYVRSSLFADKLTICFVAHNRFAVPGYGWIFPMRDHEFNVGFGMLNPRRVRRGTFNLKQKFKDFIESFPLAKELMQKSDKTSIPRAATLRYDFEGAYPFVRGPIVAVGEAIGTTLPFIGEGIGKAMESGQIAARAISHALGSDDLSPLTQYSQQIESKFKTHYRGYRMAEKWLGRPRLNDFILDRCRKSKYAQDILTGVIAETKNPHEIYSLKGIIRTFWR